jgi:phage FluMu protein Com
MSDSIVTTIRCAECGNTLPYKPSDEIIGLSCPKCGSMKMNITLELSDYDDFEVHDCLHGRVKNSKFPSRNNPRLDFIPGDDIRKADGKWMAKERIIDKDNDQYKEVVIDPATGEVVHYNEEPLSKHFGHGYAKFNQHKKA